MVDHWPVSYSLTPEEQKMIDDFRAEKNIIVNEQNEKSSNQRAVEDIERLNTYIKNHTFYDLKDGDIVDYIINEYRSLVISNFYSLNGYQTKAAETAIYPGKGTFVGLMYVALKGAGESGEFAENVGKALRDDDICDDHSGSNMFEFGELSDRRRNKLKLELGDELWYVSQKAKELGFTLEEIAQANLDKLSARAKNGTLKGSGDDR